MFDRPLNMPDFGDFNETRLLELFEQVDISSNNFLQESARYKNLPTSGCFERVVKTAGEAGTSIGEATAYIMATDTGSAEQKSQMVISLFAGDDSKRVDHFNSLFGGEMFEKANYLESSLIKLIEDLLEDDEPDQNPVILAMQVYAENAKLDLEKFVGIVDETDTAKILQTASVVGKEALKLVAIGAAAGFGAWVATRKLHK